MGVSLVEVSTNRAQLSTKNMELSSSDTEVSTNSNQPSTISLRLEHFLIEALTFWATIWE